jgi:hypothetical protein
MESKKDWGGKSISAQKQYKNRIMCHGKFWRENSFKNMKRGRSYLGHFFPTFLYF